MIAAASSKKKDDLAQSKEIIEIAQNLILQKDREQAIRILNKAYSTEKNKNIQMEIRGILKELGSLFLYEKSQQEYESSVNFKKTDPSKWFSAVEKALKIEPDNTLIVVEVARNWVNKKNIEKAKETIEEFRLKNPHDKNLVLASVFIALAAGDSKEISLIKNKVKELQLANYSIVASYLEFLEKLILGNKEKKESAFAQLKKDDPQNPQIPYWENKLLGKSAIIGAADESICGPIPEQYYRRYQHDLFFCSAALDHYFKAKDSN